MQDFNFFGPFQSPPVEVINWLHTLGMDANFFAEGFDGLVSHQDKFLKRW
jgi:hypothetical protein